MSRVRRWYKYNNAWGGQHNRLNYYFVGNLPNCCVLTADNICAVKGIYSEVLQGVPIVYGANPKTFSGDTKLSSYISAALASGNFAPSGPLQKPYVYVRNYF